MSIPKTLTVDQCRLLLVELMRSDGTEKQMTRGSRNNAMALIMLETGVRVGELCGLRVDDLWFAEQPVEFLVVRAEIAKNKKERRIPVSRILSETITHMEAILWSPKNANSGSYAFFTNDPSRALTTRTIKRIILAAGMAAFNLEVTPHMLRHTFGTRMMRKTNARVVQALLGHEKLASTQLYMHPNTDDLRKAIDS